MNMKENYIESEKNVGAVLEKAEFYLDKEKAKEGELAAIVHKGGRPEKPNEDRIYLDAAGNRFASIDGMGGAEGGALAAQILAEEIRDIHSNDKSLMEKLTFKETLSDEEKQTLFNILDAFVSKKI